jgi:hypothetical protein
MLGAPSSDKHRARMGSTFFLESDAGTETGDEWATRQWKTFGLGPKAGTRR